MAQLVKGFSLIELMVVIALVSVLSAIAVPAYKEYTYKAKVAIGVEETNALSTRIIQGFNATGVFPAVNTLGTTNPSSASEFIAPYWYRIAGGSDGTSGTDCRNGAYTYYIAGYSDTNYFVSNPDGRGIVYLRYFVENPKGIVETYCSYYEIVDNSLGENINMIPNCTFSTEEPPEVIAARAACT